METTGLTLAQIVNKNFRAAAIFEKYNLDFCCRGKRSLEDACAERKIVLNDVLSELEESGIPCNTCSVLPEFDKLPLGMLCDYIVNTHHAYIKKELPLLFNYLEKVKTKHNDRHPELHKIFESFVALKEEMEFHMQKEELIMFPRIKELEKIHASKGNIEINISAVLFPINMLEQDHEHAGRLMDEIRMLTNSFNPPPDACTTYKVSFSTLKAFAADLHQHVHLENNVLFPRTIALFRQLQASRN